MVNQVFGVETGMGVSILTFDWTQITFIGSPLMVPWWAQVHTMFGFVLFYWMIVPAMYYTNTWDFAHFPMFAANAWDRFGDSYNVSMILTNSTHQFDPEAYDNYSPLYLSAGYAMTYFIAFALSTCLLVHTALYHGRSLINGLKRVNVEPDDIHAKLMRNYPEVPDWWYMLFFVGFFGFAVLANEVWHTGLPIWGLLLAILLPTIYMLPSGFVYAMTGQGVRSFILVSLRAILILPVGSVESAC